MQHPNIQDSVKYALCILHDKFAGSVSKGLCEMYLKLNDMCHPMRDKVLENGFRDNNIPSIY